jgi:hypothetical protein
VVEGLRADVVLGLKTVPPETFSVRPSRWCCVASKPQACLTDQIQKHEAYNVAFEGYAADGSRISHSSFGFSAFLMQKNSLSGSTSIVRPDTA